MDVEKAQVINLNVKFTIHSGEDFTMFWLVGSIKSQQKDAK